ncbi:MAG: hypothetical protein M3421_00810 [Bacteroidota bacterium]|nr:hypothetical protein [Bacteroidota bacterium]
MNKYRYSSSIIIFLTLILFAFKGHNEELAQLLKNKFEKYIEVKNPDKIFIHTDRDVFYKGETIWFKAYITNSATRDLRENNDILIVQLFNKYGNAVVEKKYKASSGVVNAQLDLPDSLQGTYLLAAYNQWQLNFGQDHIFKKKIKVEAFQETKNDQEPDDLDFDFQFFPEGGVLIDSIESRVGFKATSSYGMGAEAFGYLIRNGSDTLLTFSSEHAGIGSFVFSPQSGNTYKAVVEALGLTKEFSLPDAELEGVSIRVDNSNASQIHCSLQTTNKFSAKPMVIGIFQNSTLSKGSVKHFSGAGKVSFSKDGLHPGVAVITVFDQNLLPVAERVVFIKKDLNAQIQIQFNSTDIAPRKKNNVLLDISDKAGTPISGKISATVIPARFGRDLPQANIIEYFLLTSEVKGDVEDPAYYFTDTKDADKALDNLLLVQGWRKYNWREIKNENVRLKYAREDKITLKGKVYRISNNAPFGNNSITTSVGGVDPFFNYIILDDKGEFSIDASEIPDGQLFFQSTAPYEFGIRVDLEKNTLTTLQNIDLNTPLDFSRENELRKVFAIYNSFDLLKRKQAVVALDKKKINTPYDMVVDLDEYIEFNDMAEVIKEIVPGAKIRNKRGAFEIKLLNMDSKLFYKYNPLFIVDGIPIYDLQIIMNMEHSDVKLIELIRSKERVKQYGHLGMGGVFQVRTRTGSFMPPNIEGIAGIDYKGIEKAKEFFSPKYKASPEPDNLPDFRNTLLWKPDINIGEDGKASFDFYFSDELEDIIVEVQGLTNDGIPVYAKKLIPGIRL